MRNCNNDDDLYWWHQECSDDYFTDGKCQGTLSQLDRWSLQAKGAQQPQVEDDMFAVPADAETSEGYLL